MPRDYVPAAGDIVWLQFDPTAGHEQTGRRPALVLSPAGYNEQTDLMVCCPLTSRVKGYSFEVRLADNSVVLADQMKNLDWRVRNAERRGRIGTAELAEVRGKIKALIGA